MLKRELFALLALTLSAGCASAQILPMETILSKTRAQVRGRIMEIELERKKGDWVYEVEVAQRRGKTELVFDAQTGRLLSRKKD